MKNTMKRFFTAMLAMLIVPTISLAYADDESVFFQIVNGEKIYIYENGETIDTIEKLDKSFKSPPESVIFNIDNENYTISNIKSTVRIANLASELSVMELGFMKIEVYENGEKIRWDDFFRNGMTVKIYYYDGALAGEYEVIDVIQSDTEIRDFDFEEYYGETYEEFDARMSRVTAGRDGDVNNDGVVDVSDVVPARAHIVGNNELCLLSQVRIDISHDNKVDILDVTLIRDAVVNK